MHFNLVSAFCWILRLLSHSAKAGQRLAFVDKGTDACSSASRRSPRVSALMSPRSGWGHLPSFKGVVGVQVKLRPPARQRHTT